MTDRIAESGVASWDALDVTTSPMMEIVTHDATRDDVGAMANIFIGSFKDDETARLLYPPDSIWPVVVEMIGEYLDDDYTRVITAWDDNTERMVGWTSISQVVSRREDRFEFCDSTMWAGRQLVLREARARASEGPLSVDETRRACLVRDLSRRNRDGQNRNIDGQHLAINTVAIDPDVIECEIPQIAYQLIRNARDLAKREGLPLWMQVPQNSLGDPEEALEELDFAKVGYFSMDLDLYQNVEDGMVAGGGLQQWTQWLLRNRD